MKGELVEEEEGIHSDLSILILSYIFLLLALLNFSFAFLIIYFLFMTKVDALEQAIILVLKAEGTQL